MGEVGTDTGGLSREFFRLLRNEVSGVYFNSAGGFQHNSLALQVYSEWVKVWVFGNGSCLLCVGRGILPMSSIPTLDQMHAQWKNRHTCILSIC